MLQWIKSLFHPPQPIGPARIIKYFDKSEATIAKDVVNPHEDGWLVDVAETQNVRLFDVEDPHYPIRQLFFNDWAHLRPASPEGRARLPFLSLVRIIGKQKRLSQRVPVLEWGLHVYQRVGYGESTATLYKKRMLGSPDAL